MIFNHQHCLKIRYVPQVNPKDMRFIYDMKMINASDWVSDHTSKFWKTASEIMS